MILFSFVTLNNIFVEIINLNISYKLNLSNYRVFSGKIFNFFKEMALSSAGISPYVCVSELLDYVLAIL